MGQMQQNQRRTRFTTREDVTCHKCGGKGHVATVCATRESNPGYQRTIPVKSLAVTKQKKHHPQPPNLQNHWEIKKTIPYLTLILPLLLTLSL